MELSRTEVILAGLLIMCGGTNAWILVGLGVVLLGTGLRRPASLIMIGELFPVKKDRREGSYILAYLLIETGLLAGGWLAGQKYYTEISQLPNLGYIVSAICMLIAVILLAAGKFSGLIPDFQKAERRILYKTEPAITWFTLPLLLVLVAGVIFLLFGKIMDEQGSRNAISYTWGIAGKMNWLGVTFLVGTLVIMLVKEKGKNFKKLVKLLPVLILIPLFWSVFQSLNQHLYAILPEEFSVNGYYEISSLVSILVFLGVTVLTLVVWPPENIVSTLLRLAGGFGLVLISFVVMRLSLGNGEGSETLSKSSVILFLITGTLGEIVIGPMVIAGISREISPAFKATFLGLASFVVWLPRMFERTSYPQTYLQESSSAYQAYEALQAGIWVLVAGLVIALIASFIVWSNSRGKEEKEEEI
ncbi:MAG: hypothetical protein H6581_02145 [Bacteroidia bacterium]|nr:hypothetical protein [Bacteroidia bacterium]